MNSYEKFKQDMQKAGKELTKYVSDEYKQCPAVIAADSNKITAVTSVECTVEKMGNCYVVYPKFKEDVLAYESVQRTITDDPYGTPPPTVRHSEY